MIDCIFVVIGYNNARLTEDCLESFHRSVPCAQVWLYDNASTPALQQLADKFGLPYFRSATNLGFAGGANRAIDWIIREADPRTVCLVNNDIVVSDSFGMALDTELHEFGEDPHLAAMTPLLYTDQDLRTPENFGVLYYRSGLAFQNRTRRLDPRALLNGAFLFLKTEICKELVSQDGAVFRPFYFFNAEDIELSLRLLSRGYALRVNSNMRVQHLGSQSAQNVSIASFRLAWRNLLWTLFITRSNQELLADVPFILVGQLVQFALAALRGRPNLVSSVVAETWAHRKQLIEARRRFLALQQHGFRSFIKPGVFPLARPLAVLRRAN